MDRDQAFQILNIVEADIGSETLEERYKRYMEANDPDKGGSFYLQSKIFRAKEFLDAEVAESSGQGDAPGKTKEDDV